MRRRRILFATFGVVASAGCIGSQEEPTGDQNEEEETRESTDPEADAQPEEPDPAEFEITDLVVEPTDISPGESVSVTTTVENVGDESGTYSVELQINSQVQDTTDVELGGGERSIVEFEYSIDTAGKYEVRVDTLKETVMVTAEPDLTIQSKERASADTPYHDSYVEAVVENMGQARSGSVKVTARWFDESGSFIGDRSTYLPTLGVGETWIARIGLPRNGDQVKDFEITGQYEIQAGANPDGMSIVDSSLNNTSEQGRSITAEVKNEREEELFMTTFTGVVYDDVGHILGGDSTRKANVPPGEDLFFEISISTSRMVHSVSDITDYEVMLLESINSDTREIKD